MCPRSSARVRMSSLTFQTYGLTLGHCVPYKYMSSTRQLTQRFCTPNLRIFTWPRGEAERGQSLPLS